MYSWTVRLNSVFTFSVTVMSVLAACHVATVFFTDAKPIVNKLELIEQPSKYIASGTTASFLKFDLDADMTPVWNWNVKLLFVQVFAEFQTPKNKRNSVVVWDTMIKSKDKAHLIHSGEKPFPRQHVKGEPFYYFIQDQDGGLAKGANVTLILNWYVMPVVGGVFNGSMPISSFMFPKFHK